MIGKNTLVIDSKNFLAGMGSSDYANDAGFSSASLGTNITTTPGVLKNFPSVTDCSTNVAADFIASCGDTGTTTPKRGYFLDGSKNFYSFDSTTVTKQATGTKTYTYGLADLVPFTNKYYATSATDLTQWDGAATLDESYWTTTKSKTVLGAFPHPMIVFNKKLWIADGQYLHSLDASLTATEQALDLGSGQVIYALGIDPGTGLMLISSQVGASASLAHALPRLIWMYDGASGLPTRKIPTNELVTAFHSVAGVVYVGMGQYIGYWTGSGIEPLRRLLNVTYDSDFLPYKAHLTNIGPTLYVIDGKNVLAYGPVGLVGKKAWYHAYKPSGTFDHLTLICDVGAGSLGVYHKTTTPTYVFELLNTSTSGTNPATLYTNRYEFPRPVYIRKMRVFTTGVTTTSGSGQVGIWNDEEDISHVPTISQFKVTSGTKYVFDFDFGGKKVQTAQFFVQLPSQNCGLNRVVVYYDPAE